jgi:hypothetical protein
MPDTTKPDTRILTPETLAEIEEAARKRPNQAEMWGINALCQTVRAAWRERDLAVAHDRQPYPTAEAYEKACEALNATKAQLAQVEQELTIARRFLVRQGFYRCTDSACGCGGKDWHERLTL